MKVLVVFDNTTEASQNLWTALRSAKSILEDKPQLKKELEVRVCVLELLREDKALDDYLVEMEHLGQQSLEGARHIVSQSGLPGVTLELLRGMEPEAAQLIAKRANQWEADQIYLSMGRECYICAEQQARQAKHRHKPFFGFGLFKRPAQPQTKLPETVLPSVPQTTVEIEDLLNLAGCRLTLTCHGEAILTMQKHHPKAGLHSERVVCERNALRLK